MDSLLLDSRYHNLGALPSQGLVYPEASWLIRPFTVNELMLVHTYFTTNDFNYILRAIQICFTGDILNLTDGDFMYLLAWQRSRSYPQTPLDTFWTCNAIQLMLVNSKYAVGPTVSEEQRTLMINQRKAEYRPCGWKNRELVYGSKTKVISLDEKDPPVLMDGLTFPRVNTLAEYLTLVHEKKNTLLDEYARWIKHGTTLKDKVQFLEQQTDLSLIEHIKEYKTRWFHGVLSVSRLKCNNCGAKYLHTNELNIPEALADNTEQALLDMQHQLAAGYSIPPNDDMPSKKFLYFYSKLSKEKKEAEQRAKLNATNASYKR